MKNKFVEFTTASEETILIRMENITLVKKNSPTYPKFVTTYKVFVNTWSWLLKEKEGEVLYNKYKEYLTNEYR